MSLAAFNARLDELHHCGLLGVSCEKRTLGYFAALVYLGAGLLFYSIVHWGPSDAVGAGLRHTARQQPSVQAPRVPSRVGPGDGESGSGISHELDGAVARKLLRGSDTDT